MKMGMRFIQWQEEGSNKLFRLLKIFFHSRRKILFNEKIILSNTSPTVPLTMTFGGMFSRGLGIDFIGVPLLVKGAQQNCHTLYQLVENTKKDAIKETNNNVIILDNQNFKV